MIRHLISAHGGEAMRKPTLALLPVVAAAAFVCGVPSTQVIAAAPAGAKHAINAVLIFDVEAHTGNTFQAGDNFTPVFHRCAKCPCPWYVW